MAISADELFAETMTPEMIEASDRRAKELLDEFDTLQKLRKARALTQEHIGKKMGTKQVSIAQLEKRSDFLLSTLRGYVKALGGELDLLVRFDDHPPVRLSGLGEESLSEPPKKASAGVRSSRGRRRTRSAAAA
ncbi:helix-turn-helix transcriptional regulator [uncultured Roseibium sp.]|uniref:helix-turn-helix domain-containing protein n=1 Tax=uncultured Roseibium sp. TaxID=1936171 RepID=UPI002604546A|nr:helix-turn-helix transcriptional regulator [uncultured Roseibium sp.]